MDNDMARLQRNITELRTQVTSLEMDLKRELAKAEISLFREIRQAASETQIMLVFLLIDMIIVAIDCCLVVA